MAQPSARFVDAPFDWGERVLLVIKRKGRQLMVPVKVVGQRFGVSSGGGPDEERVYAVTTYRVTSGRGGDILVDAEDLRSDNILDRIALALD